MQILRASPGDAPALSAIAWAGKAHWGYPVHWLEQGRDQLTITPGFIAANDIFAAHLEERIAAFHAIFETPDSFRLEHLWVLPERIGQGIGRTLFLHAAERAAARGGASLTIEADPHAEFFFQHMGAVRISTTTSEIEGRRRKLPLLAFDLRKN